MKIRSARAVMVCVAFILIAALPACTTAPNGASPARDNAGETVEAWGAALAAGDIDALLALCSGDFQHPQWGDKEGLRAFFTDAQEKGFFDGGRMSPEYIGLRTDGGAIVAYPVEYESNWGPVVFELTLYPERETWKIFRLRMEQF